MRSLLLLATAVRIAGSVRLSSLPTDFPSLTAALEASAQMESALIDLGACEDNFELLADFQVENSLEIRGCGQVLTLRAMITVDSRLVVSGVTLSSGVEPFPCFFTVNGHLRLRDVEADLSTSTHDLVLLAKGTLEIHESKLVGFRETSALITGWNCTVDLTHVEVSDSWGFISSSMSHGDGNALISIDHSTIASIQDALIKVLPSPSSPGSGLAIRITSSHLESTGNYIVYVKLDDASGQRLSLEASNSTFANNAMVLHAKVGAGVQVSGCELSISIAACSFSTHYSVVQIHVLGSLRPADNRFSIHATESTFTSIAMVFEFSMLGVSQPSSNLFELDFTHCSVTSSDLVLCMTMSDVVQPAGNKHSIFISSSDFSFNRRVFYLSISSVSQPSDNLYSLQLADSTVSTCSEVSIQVVQPGLSQPSQAFEFAFDSCAFVSNKDSILSLPPGASLRASNSTFYDTKYMLARLLLLSGDASAYLTIEVVNCSFVQNEYSIFFLEFVETTQAVRSLTSIAIVRCFFESNYRVLSFEITGSGPHSGLLHSLEVTHSSFKLTGHNVFMIPMRKVSVPSGDSIPLLLANCDFVRTNRHIMLLEMDQSTHNTVNFTTIRISNCVFRENGNSGIHFYRNWPFSAIDYLPGAALISFDSCTWSEQVQLIYDAITMNWRVAFFNSTVTRHISSSVIFISGQGACAFDVDGFTSYNTSSDIVDGMFYAANCNSVLFNVSIFNFTYGFPSTKSTLIQFREGTALLENIDVVESGTPGFVIFCFSSTLTVRNSRFISTYIGGHGLIVSALSYMRLSNLTFSDVMKKEATKGPAFDRPVFIGWSLSHVDMEDIVVDKQTYTLNESGYWGVFMVSIGTFSISGARLDGLLTDTIGILYSSSGSIANMTCRNVTFQTFALSMYRGSSISARNCSFDSVSAVGDGRNKFFRHIRGFALIGAKSQLNLTDIQVAGSNFTTLFVLSQSYLFTQAFAMKEGYATTIIEESVLSTVNITNTSFDSVRAGEIFSSNSDVTLSHCTFRNVSVDTELFRASSSQITLANVSLDQVVATSRLGRIEENSTLTVVDNDWRHVYTLEGEGFVISSGTMRVEKSAFTAFNFTLFQLSDTQYSISESVLRDGWIATKSAKSKYAFGAFVSCVNCKQGVVEAISAFNLSALVGGVFAFQSVQEVPASVSISRSEFTFCSAERGGAIYFGNTLFTITDSVFEYNSAATSGGAIEVLAAAVHQLLQNCAFRGNRAVSGGAVKWHRAPIALVNATFRSNEALYGPDLASFPVALISNLTSNSTLSSGFPASFQFQLVDHYRQTVATANNKALQLRESDTLRYKGNSATFSDEGVFTFTDVTIYAKPAFAQKITGLVEDYFEGQKLLIHGEVEVYFRNCSVGEIYRSDQCELCNVGNVSYSIDDPSCTACPANAFCFGGSNMTVNPRYWRSAWNSTLVLECPLPDKCVGGPNSTCVSGFTGKLCNECAKNTYRTRVTECVECSGLVWLQLIGIALTTTLFAWTVIKYGERHPSEFKLFVVKCFVNHGQLLSAMALFRVSYPAVITNSLRAVAYMSTLGVIDLPIACFGFSDTEHIRAVIGSAIFPLAAVSCFPGLYLFIRNRRRAAIILLTSLSLFTPAATVQLVVPLLACISAGTKDLWLFVDMSQKCWEGRHAVLVTDVLVPSILLNSVLPMLVAVVLYSASAASFQRYYPMWSAGYKLQQWDAAFAIAKCTCLWLMLNSISYEKLTQVAYGLVCLVVLCVFTVSLHMHVFKTSGCFFLAETSPVIVIASFGLGTYYVYNVPGNRVTDYFVVGAFLILNGGYFACCLALLYFKKNIPIIQVDIKCESADVPKLSNPPNSFASSFEVPQEAA